MAVYILYQRKPGDKTMQYTVWTNRGMMLTHAYDLRKRGFETKYQENIETNSTEPINDHNDPSLWVSMRNIDHD